MTRHHRADPYSWSGRGNDKDRRLRHLQHGISLCSGTRKEWVRLAFFVKSPRTHNFWLLPRFRVFIPTLIAIVDYKIFHCCERCENYLVT